MEREWLGERRLRQRLLEAQQRSHCGVPRGQRQRGEVVKSARPDPVQSCRPWLGLEVFISGVNFKQGLDEFFGSQSCSDSWDEQELCLELCGRCRSHQGLEMTVGRAESYSVPPSETVTLGGSVGEREF